MKILFTSDIHASDTHLFSMISIAEKAKVDCVIIGGDIIPHYLPNTHKAGILQAQEIYLRDVFLPAVEQFKEKRDIPIYLDLGNDDFKDNRKMLEVHDGNLFHLLHMRKHPLTDTVDILGYMNVPPTPFWRKDWEKPDSSGQLYAPGNIITLNGSVSVGGMLKETVLDLNSDDTIENELSLLSETIEKPFIFVSHSPPYRTPLDVIYDGTHVGSLAIKEFIETWSENGQLVASLHGHIHESPSRSGSVLTKIGNSVCINPGQGNGKGAAFRYVIFRLAYEEMPPSFQMLYEPDSFICTD
ncbi:metallophosphoesterase family protein [Desulfonema magnum]|uniref:Metallophosphoesterase family protein n=1 Tax=Desulfonema magnum TaxID=45655 RepID=A0A975GK76_9BACT|nr:metallophosphoesterase [Desulfonema magnum]QTA84416.1 Metallophosphoesterase family protein [Desulfonema magnum]